MHHPRKIGHASRRQPPIGDHPTNLSALRIHLDGLVTREQITPSDAMRSCVVKGSKAPQKKLSTICLARARKSDHLISTIVSELLPANEIKIF
jgi:hypothetical protein